MVLKGLNGPGSVKLWILSLYNTCVVVMTGSHLLIRDKKKNQKISLSLFAIAPNNSMEFVLFRWPNVCVLNCSVIDLERSGRSSCQ